jgi:hypothetical protein
MDIIALMNWKWNEAQGGVGVAAAGPQRKAAILVSRGLCPLRIGGGAAVQMSRTGL